MTDKEKMEKIYKRRIWLINELDKLDDLRERGYTVSGDDYIPLETELKAFNDLKL